MFNCAHVFFLYIALFDIPIDLLSLVKKKMFLLIFFLLYFILAAQNPVESRYSFLFVFSLLIDSGAFSDSDKLS